MKKANHFLLWIILLCLAAFNLSGCSTPATFEAMVPDRFEITNKHTASVKVVVDGGRETSMMWKSQISSESFKQALVEAINKSQTFSKIIQGPSANYELSVILFSLEQPTFGASFGVELEAGWIVKRIDTNKVVWRESITTSYTATMSDAIVAVNRLQIATEGAARKNITEGLAKISKLSL